MITANLVKELREKSGAGMLDCKKALEASNGSLEEAMKWLKEKGISQAQKKASRIAAEGLSAIKTDEKHAVIVEVNSETDFVAKNEEFQNLVETILDTILTNEVDGTIESALNLKTENGTLNDLIVAKTAKIGEKISLRRYEKVQKSASEVFGSYIHMGGKIAVLTILENVSEEVAKDVAMHAAAMRPTYIKKENVPESVLEEEKNIFKEQAINEGKNEEIALKMVQGRVNKFYKEVCLEEQPFVKDSSMSVKEYVKKQGGSVINMVRYEVGEGLQKREENFAEEVAKQING